jgi:glyoxylase-like metal-dependent hydrolase (beta-lactamase superfamily II)
LHRINLGDFELTFITDGRIFLDGGAMFGAVPKPLWEKKITPDAQNRLLLAMNSLAVRTGDHTVLIETGAGNKLPEKTRSFFENQELLLSNLDAAGFAPDDFDIVINTHLHFDHCGWNTLRRADGVIVPTFPRARYYFQRGELAHAHEQHERDRVSYLTDNYDPLVASGHALLLTGDAPIVPGIRVQLTPGHTAHHQSVFIESQNQKAAYVGDLIPTSAHLHPSWIMGYDLSPIDTIDHRHRYYRDAIPQRRLTVFTHDPAVPWAYIARDASGRYLAEPVVPIGDTQLSVAPTDSR